MGNGRNSDLIIGNFLERQTLGNDLSTPFQDSSAQTKLAKCAADRNSLDFDVSMH